ncbi:hypothetical protein BT69DRAFT_1347455 [Atractiella rhizophila]|nr:hypothetical protein BT69DRAFT_1347455 [Atractiella rhizophila]
MSPPALTSSLGLLSLLDEPTPTLVTHALTTLSTVVDLFWFEISNSLSRLEIIYESSPSEKDRRLAATILSRVHWHLGNQTEALEFALGAGEEIWGFGKAKFQSGGDEWVEAVVATCIDQYISIRNAKEPPKEEDTRLLNIIETIFQTCLDDGEYKQAIGLALDSKRLDVLQKAFKLSKDSSLLEYVLDAIAMGGEGGGKREAEWREQVLNLLISLFSTLATPDYFSITRCFVLLSASGSSSQLLLKLLSSPTPSDVLMAYQIAFDLSSTGSQDFIADIRTCLTSESSYSADPEDMERVMKILTGEVSTRFQLEFLVRNNKADLLILKNIKESLELRNSVYHSAMSFANAFAHSGTTSDQFLRENLDWLARASNWSKFTATTALGVIHRGNLQAKEVACFALGLVHANHPEAEVTGFLLRVLRSFGASPTIQTWCRTWTGVAHLSSGSWEVYEDLKVVLFSDDAVAGEAAGYAMGLVMLGKRRSER